METPTPTPTPSLNNHLTSKCPQHNVKITSISKFPDGSTQFLCKLCKPKLPNDKTYHLADILDDEILALLNEKIDQQIKDSGSSEEKQAALFQFLDRTFAGIKEELESILNTAQDKLRKKYSAYIHEKKAQETNWVDVKQAFEARRSNFINTEPAKESEELDKYLKTYTEVMDHLSKTIEDQKAQDYDVNHDEITRFRKQFQAQTDVLTEKLLKFNLGHLSIKIDAIKEESCINTGHKGVFKALTVLEDLNMFATGSTDGELGLWDSENLTQIHKSKVHKTYITSILYIPTRKVLVTASLDRTIKVFEVAQRKINTENCTTLTGHKSFIYGLCYLPDKNQFASVGQDPDIKIWNIDTLKLDFTISTNGWGSDSYEMVYIQDEGLIGVVGKDIIRLYNYQTKQLAQEIKTGGLSMQSLQYLKKQRALVAAVEKGKISVWTVETGGNVKHDRDITFEAIGDTPYTILALEEQNVLAVTTRSKFVCFINLNNGNLVKKGTALKDGIAIAFLKNQGKMILADNGSEKLTVFTI